MYKKQTKQLLLLLITTVAIGCADNQKHINTNSSSAELKQNKKLVWSDDFDINGLPDTSKWNYSIGDGCPIICGWGNNEAQYYTESSLKNARIDKGILIIEAHKEQTQTQSYSSAKLVTKGIADWQYGRVEVNAKLPTGRGTWPAIWMLPTEDNYGNWPASGEIDIMEHVGYLPDSIFGTVHTASFNHIIGTQVGQRIAYDDLSTTFKTYAIDWTPSEIIWYIDDIEYHRFANRNLSSKEWPFDQAFYLILNLAVGGNWGGKEGIDDSIWPQRMEVDWVKVWQ